jgi:putative PIN family toxin of toxin-antitoxin system
MENIRAIIDTNVLYAGLYSSLGASYQVLRAIEQDQIRIVLSTTLVFEYEDVLKRDPDVLGLTDHAIEALLDDLCHRSEHQAIYFLWRPCLSDPKDDHIVELAVASETPLIITHNVKDFKNATAFDVQILTPSQLLEELR